MLPWPSARERASRQPDARRAVHPLDVEVDSGERSGRLHCGDERFEPLVIRAGGARDGPSVAGAERIVLTQVGLAEELVGARAAHATEGGRPGVAQRPTRNVGRRFGSDRRSRWSRCRPLSRSRARAHLAWNSQVRRRGLRPRGARLALTCSACRQEGRIARVRLRASPAPTLTAPRSRMARRGFCRARSQSERRTG